MINMLIPKNKRGIYIRPLGNCKMDNYDIINHTGDTALTLINYMIDKIHDGKYTVFLEIYHPQRKEQYRQYVLKNKNISFNFVSSSKCFSSVKALTTIIRNLFIRFSCSYWISECVPDIKSYAIKSQKQFIVGYFASCKSDYIYNKKAAAELRRFSQKSNVIIFSTSFLDSIIKSSAYGVPMECFLSIGMARNDLLADKTIPCKANEWLKEKKFTDKTKVILYAPTFRDYESINDVKSRSIWGENYDDDLICNFLKKNDMIVIAKLHSWQNKNAILEKNKSIILYEPTFDFSFYDLFKLSDMMITDYSSIGLDWLFMNKPLIYNLWDYEVYHNERGFAYEPYDDLCGGKIVKNDEELVIAIKETFDKDLYAEKRTRIRNVMYSVQDFSSSEKICKLLLSYINGSNS